MTTSLGNGSELGGGEENPFLRTLSLWYDEVMKEIKVQTLPDGPLIQFFGDLDQHMSFPDPKKIEGQTVVMDFSGLKLMNSLGVRNFILFCQGIEAKVIIFRNCPCLMVNQFNMVQGMVTSRVKVESFYAPYFAPIAEEELELLLYAEEVVRGKAPKREHPKTGEELEFDDLDERYFYFLRPTA